MDACPNASDTGVDGHADQHHGPNGESDRNTSTDDHGYAIGYDDAGRWDAGKNAACVDPYRVAHGQRYTEPRCVRRQR